MLTLLPALLTIFGRRAFWPFVPHTPRWAAPDDVGAERPRQRIVEGSRFGALLPVIGARAGVLHPAAARRPHRRCCAGSSRWSAAGQDPRCRQPLRPLGLQALRGAAHAARAPRGRHPRLLEARGRPGGRAARARVLTGSMVVLLVMCAGLAFFSTDLTTNDGYRTEVESVEGQDILAQSFPAGAERARRRDRAARRRRGRRVTRALEETDGIEAVSPPVAEGEQGMLVQATLEPPPYSTEAFDLVEPIRDAATGAVEGTVVGGASAVEFDVREAAGLGLDRDPADRARGGVPDPGAAAAGGDRAADPDRHGDPELPRRARGGLLRVRRLLRLPRLGSVAAAVRVRVPGGAGGGLQHLPDGAGPRGDRSSTARARACCERWR